MIMRSVDGNTATVHTLKENDNNENYHKRSWTCSHSLWFIGRGCPLMPWQKPHTSHDYLVSVIGSSYLWVRMHYSQLWSWSLIFQRPKLQGLCSNGLSQRLLLPSFFSTCAVSLEKLVGARLCFHWWSPMISASSKSGLQPLPYQLYSTSSLHSYSFSWASSVLTTCLSWYQRHLTGIAVEIVTINKNKICLEFESSCLFLWLFFSKVKSLPFKDRWKALVQVQPNSRISELIEEFGMIQQRMETYNLQVLVLTKLVIRW